MPSLQYLDLNPRQLPREETTLEKTLGAFADNYTGARRDVQERDALKDIYSKYQQEGDMLNTMMELNTRPGISPTTRVNTAKQLMDFQKYNTELQEATNKKMELQQKVKDTEKKEAEAKAEKDRKLENQRLINLQLAQERNLTPEQVAPYEDNPSLLERTTRPIAPPRVNQSDRPIDPQQQENITKVLESPYWENATIPQKQQLLARGNVSNSNQKAILDPLIEEQKLKNEQEKISDQKVDSAYKAQEKFIDETTNKYKAFETDTKPKLLQMQKLATDDELIGPTTNAFLEQLGIPLGALDNPDSELYNKLSLDLLKGLPETYGNRILKVEVDNFLKTVPGLSNSPEGRRLIASNILKLGEMKEVYYNAMRQKQREYLDNNKPLPRDFQQVVFDQVKPQIDKINNEFVKLSEIKSVPKDTIPFFDPDGNVVFVPKEHAKWAEGEGGGKRIW